ncbi:MAG TPA: ABC transporter substrate-binding protein [Stellaceae bacterium]|nr:ABC transporter substrate-binding protein [Stellaceae bacterium]
MARCVVAFCLACAALVPAAGAMEINPALAALAQGATAEGALTLSWSTTTFGGPQGAARFESEMNALFGTKVSIAFVPGADMARVGNQLATEFQAGQKAHTDIFLGAAPQVSPLIKLDMFEHVKWTEYLPGRIAPEFVEADGQAIRVVTGLSGVTYNSQLAPMKPTTLADFLKPEWKGRIASTPYAASLDVLLADDMWGGEKTIAYVRALSKQIAGLIRCGETERLATGEFLALVMDCTGQDAVLWQAKGAPIAQLLPLDAGEERYYYFTVPKNAQHPDAAKLFTVFLMTPEGQKLAWETWAIDLHSLPGSHTGPQIEAFAKAGGKAKEVTAEWWMKHPEVERDRQQIIKILSTKD